KSGEYKSWAKKIPSMIQMNGFGQTVAFLYSKKDKDPYKTFYTQISTWLKEKKFLEQTQELVDEICKVDSAKYRLMTTETLSLFGWLRRFAEGMIEDKKPTEETK
ncbi:type III-B CRISPR module-associated protein Cmr5, partial [bacterium]|nr:type III-B CRISPR module-associated protein Cmr5 [bacterium]